MSASVATIEAHEALADEARALVDLVATHSFDPATLAAARDALASVRATLAAAGTSVGTEQPGGVPRWPVERSAISGPLNPFAPPLRVVEQDDGLVGSMTYPRSLQGPPEHAHGGHLAMVFDHLAGRAAGRSGKPVVTGRLAVRYHRPTPVGRPIRFTAKVRESRHSLVTVECASYDADVRTASAEITFVELSAGHFEQAFGEASGRRGN